MPFQHFFIAFLQVPSHQIDLKKFVDCQGTIRIVSEDLLQQVQIFKFNKEANSTKQWEITPFPFISDFLKNFQKFSYL